MRSRLHGNNIYTDMKIMLQGNNIYVNMGSMLQGNNIRTNMGSMLQGNNICTNIVCYEAIIHSMLHIPQIRVRHPLFTVRLHHSYSVYTMSYSVFTLGVNIRIVYTQHLAHACLHGLPIKDCLHCYK